MQQALHPPEADEQILGCDATIALTRGCASVCGDLALSSLGPAGRCNVISAHSSAAASIITSTSGRLFQGINWRDHLSRLLLQSTADAQHQRYGDGGLLCVHLACRLITAALDAGGTHAGRMRMCMAYQQALDWLVDLLGQTSSAAAADDDDLWDSSSEEDDQHAAVRLHAPRDAPCEAPASGRSAVSGTVSSTVSSTTSSTISSTVTGSTNVGSSQRGKITAVAGGVRPHDDQRSTGRNATSVHGVPPASPRVPPAMPLWALCLRVEATHLPTLMALVRGVVSTKQAAGLRGPALEAVCVTLVQSYILAATSLQAAAPPPAPGQPPNVRVLTVGGLDVGFSVALPGVLISHVLPPMVGKLLPRRNVVVALFNVSLDAGGMDGPMAAGARAAADGRGVRPGAAALQASGEGDEWSASAEELHRLLQLVECLKGMGVTVVACQKVIHPAVQEALVSRGLVPLQRLSIAHITSVAHLTGALPIGSLQPSPAWRQAFGVVGAIRLRVFCDKTYTHLEPATVPPAKSSADATPWDQQAFVDGSSAAVLPLAPCFARRVRPVVTCVLGASTDTAADELRVAAESAVKVLGWSVQVPYALPGGGCCELMMAAHLRRNALAPEHRCTALQSEACEAFASALESAAAALLPAIDPAFELLDALRDAEVDTEEQLGRAEVAGHAGQQPLVELLGWNEQLLQLGPVASCTLQLPVPSLLSTNRASGSGGPAAGQRQQQRRMLSVRVAAVLDSLVVKLASLSAAVDAACMVLKVDGVLAATH